MLRWGFLVGCAAGAIAFAACGGDDFVEGPKGGGGTGQSSGGGGTTGVGGDGGVATGPGGAGGSPPVCFDNDMDGVTDCEGDCDDADPTSYPGATEICGDGADNDCDMTPDQASVCMGLGTYVSEITGDDVTGFGTQLAPWKSIGQGIATAITLGGGQDVYVAEGTYGEAVDMVDEVSVLGGHQCDANGCTWARDPALYVSIINNTNRRGVYADITVNAPTALDGFTINGQNVSGNGGFQTPGTAAVTLDGASLVVSNNIIHAGNEGSCSSGNECGSFGVRVAGPTNNPAAGAVIQNNEIHGGSSISHTCGALNQHRNSSIVKVLDNVIYGGSCNWNRAVIAGDAGFGTQYIGNQVFAGDQVGGGTSFAMFVAGYAEIDKNLINTDPIQTGSCPQGTNFWCGGIESAGAVATITNNVVFGMAATKSVGIFIGDNEVAVGLVTINANTVHAGGAQAGGAVSTNIATAMACRTNVGVNGQIGQLRNNILIGGYGQNRFGFYEQDDNNGSKTCRPIAFDNNDIHFLVNAGGSDNAYSQWAGGMRTNLNMVAQVNALAFANANIGLDPDLDATWHLNAGSPCIDAGTTTQAPATDIDGEQRPQGNGIDIGADEAG